MAKIRQQLAQGFGSKPPRFSKKFMSDVKRTATTILHAIENDNLPIILAAYSDAVESSVYALNVLKANGYFEDISVTFYPDGHPDIANTVAWRIYRPESENLQLEDNC